MSIFGHIPIYDGFAIIGHNPCVTLTAANGHWQYCATPIFHALVPIEDAVAELSSEDGRRLATLSPMVSYNERPLPDSVFAEIMHFCRLVKEHFDAHRTVALLFVYDAKTMELDVIVPPQRITSAACQYDTTHAALALERHQRLVGSICSFGSFAAIVSRSVQEDERHFDGLHVLIGCLDQPEIECSARIVIGGRQVAALSPSTVFAGVHEVQTPSSATDPRFRVTYDASALPQPSRAHAWLDQLTVVS